MKILLLFTVLLAGCSFSKKPAPPIMNPSPIVPFELLDVDNNGTISTTEYAMQGTGSYSTEEPVITIVVIVMCVVVLTGGLAWVYRSSDNNNNIYDKEE